MALSARNIHKNSQTLQEKLDDFVVDDILKFHYARMYPQDSTAIWPKDVEILKKCKNFACYI